MATDATQRLPVLTQASIGVLTNAEAAHALGLSERQVRRLKKTLTRGGPAALVHGNRGRRPAHRLPDDLRARLVSLAGGKYAGHGQQRLCELLAEREGIQVARSTLRRVFREGGLPAPHQRRAPRLPRGAMPVAFDLARRRVELLDLSGASYREPFFHQTVERQRKEQPNALRFELDLDELMAAARREPGRQPDGLIFHVGRCGSTLLANMLSVPDEHLVIKESPAVNALVAGVVSAADQPRREEREALLEVALPYMFRPSRGEERRLLFKLTSWNTRLAATLLRLFPNTPAIFLYRSARATVASMLAETPGWQSLFGRPRAVQTRYFPTLESVSADTPLSPAAFYAHAWRSAVEAALDLPPQRLLLIEYKDIVSRLEPTLGLVAAHFDLSGDPVRIASMAGAQAVYSKDPGGQAGFEPGGAHRRAALDAGHESEVLAVIGDLSSRLSARHQTKQRLCPAPAASS